MAGKSDVVVRFLGDTTGLDKAVNKSQSSLGKFGQSVSAIGNKIGGEFGEALSQIGEAIDRVGEKGKGFGAKMAVAGGAVTGLGVALQALGSANKQATDQLDAAIQASGHTWDEYGSQIDDVIGKMADFGHSDDDTQNALQKLTQATNDPTKALAEMGTVANLAAAQHISLADAAGQVAKILGGSGARTLAQYGIHMGQTASGTKDVQGALDQLSKKLDGQATASVNNFGAQVNVMRTKLGDWAAEMANRVGPALTVIGPLMMGVGTIIQSGVIPKIRAAAVGFKELSASTILASKGLRATVAATAALAGLSYAANHLADASINAGKGANELSDSLTKIAHGGAADASLGFQVAEGDVRSFNDALWLAADSHAWDQLGTSVAGVVGVDTTFALAKKSIDQVDASLSQMVSSGHAADAAAAFKALGDSFAKQGGDVSKLTSMFPQYRDALAGAATGTDGLSTSLNDNAAAAKDNRSEIQKLKDSIDKLRGTAISADEATSNLRQAVDDTAQAAKDDAHALKVHNGVLDLTSPKARDADAALRNLASTALDGVSAWAQNGAGAADVKKKTQQARDAFVDAATKMGLSKKATQDLSTAYGLIPSKVATRVTSTTGAAQSALDNLLRTLRQLAQTVHIDVRAGTQGTGGGRRTVPAMASGGIVTRPTLALIGEAGPEAVVPLGRGGGIGGGDVHVHIHGGVFTGSSLEVARQLQGLMRSAQGAGVNFGIPA